jgi:hypothetical protein
MLRSVPVTAGAAPHDAPLAAGSGVEVRAACARCEVVAAAWTLPDGRREPHAIPVTLTTTDLREAQRHSLADGHGLTLAPGVWGVRLRGAGAPRGVWQVVVGPGDHDTVTLPP